MGGLSSSPLITEAALSWLSIAMVPIIHSYTWDGAQSVTRPMISQWWIWVSTREYVRQYNYKITIVAEGVLEVILHIIKYWAQLS